MNDRAGRRVPAAAGARPCRVTAAGTGCPSGSGCPAMNGADAYRVSFRGARAALAPTGSRVPRGVSVDERRVGP